MFWNLPIVQKSLDFLTNIKQVSIYIILTIFKKF